MRESDVKQGLLKYFQERHNDSSEMLVVEEVCLNQGRTRADVVVVNGHLHGFEIKSPKDSLARLQRQLLDYRAVFDEVTLVIGVKHLTGVLGEIPGWCGILLASPLAGAVSIEEFRPSRQNLERDRHALAQLLWRPEALEVLKRHGCAKGVLSKPRPVLWQRLADSLSTDDLSAEVRAALCRRPSKWRADLRDAPPAIAARGRVLTPRRRRRRRRRRVS